MVSLLMGRSVVFPNYYSTLIKYIRQTNFSFHFEKPADEKMNMHHGLYNIRDYKVINW